MGTRVPAVPAEGYAVSGGGWGRALSFAPPVLVAVLPKCSVCVMAHATVLSALGIATVPAQRWLPPVAALSLVAALALLAYRASRRRGYRPFSLACVAALLLLVELTHTHPAAAAVHASHGAGAAADGAHGPLVTWTGVALLLAASVWNAWPAARTPASAIPARGDGCGHAC